MTHHVVEHRHRIRTHAHHQHGPHRHVRLPFVSDTPAPAEDHGTHDHGAHGHTHGRVDPTVLRSREGVVAVSRSLGVLAATAAIQAIVLVASGSVALLADLIHNSGDALTALPLGAAFLFRSARLERWAGRFVVATILASAAAGAVEAVLRVVHPQHITHVVPLALAGVVGFIGNETAGRIRLRAGERLDSPALTADGQHARVDGIVSLGVVLSAVAIAVHVNVADPIIGLAITALILRITWHAWRTVNDDH